MKKLLTILILVTAVISITGPASSEDRREYEERGGYPGKFYGIVDSLPESGGEGIWIINGREVLVTGSTEIEEEYGKAVAGSYVEVKGNYKGKTFTAYEIEVKGAIRYGTGEKKRRGSPREYPSHRERVYNSKFAGIIDKMPQAGYEGTWTINGRKVEITSSTLIDETKGKAEVGSYAKVKGLRRADSITALEINIGDSQE